MRRKTDAPLIGIAFFCFIGFGSTAGLMGVAWPSVRDTFSTSLDAIGALFFASMIGALWMNVNSGRVIARIGLGRVLALGSAIGALGLWGCALAPAWWVMVVVALLSGVGGAGVITGINTFFAINQSARLMNWLQACFGLGAAFSPLIMSRWLDTGHSWRWGYAFVGLVFALFTAAFAYTASRWQLAQPANPAGTAEQPDRASTRDIFRLPGLWLSLLLFFTFTGLEGASAQWPYTLFTEGRSIDPGVAGLWVSIYWACVTFGRIFFGIVVGRVRVAWLLRSVMAGAICGTALIWTNFSDTLSFLGLAITGFSLSPLFPVMMSGTPERLGSEHAASAIGYQQAAVRLGLAAIPALAGFLAERSGVEIIAPFLFAVAIFMFVQHELLAAG